MIASKINFNFWLKVSPYLYALLIFLLLLTVAGIGLGTYLVQNRTNFTPFAATDGCGETGSRSGDESKCVKFKVTTCNAEGSNGKCGVKFEWGLPNLYNHI